MFMYNCLTFSEINQLRREVRTLRAKLREKEEALRPKSYSAKQSLPPETTSSLTNNNNMEITAEEAKREIELQKMEIQALRDKIEQYEGMLVLIAHKSSEIEREKEVMNSAGKARSRPISREKLPPMEGFEK